MAEYIERESFFKFLTGQMTRKQNGAFAKGFNKGIMVARAAVHNREITPSADVVEVVRCKDCAYFVSNNLKYCNKHIDCWGSSEIYVDDDDFCSYGERLEADGDKNG